jgi:pyridoxine/pyridoxamine 5'-phosphate oxidase
MTSAQAAAQAQRIIDSIMYMTLATAAADGRPWASPVWFAAAPPSDFLWASDPGARHSRNIAARPEVAVVIFDSTAPIGSAAAVYVEGTAEELGGEALERAISIYSKRSTAVGAAERTLADVTPPARLRLYPATASAIFVLDAGDRRQAVSLDDLASPP